MRPLTLKHAQRPIQAARDDHGVPHVRAQSIGDAIYALGYLHAVDRPTQMYFGRAVAAGRSAELIADRPELMETDRFFRRIRLNQHEAREISLLDALTIERIDAYCAGVNDGIKQAGRSLPMWATGFRPEPWDRGAVLLMGNLLNYAGLVVGQQQNERLLVELIQIGVDEARLRELFAPMLDEADFDLLRQVRMPSRLSDEALELLSDLPRLAGSNAWAISAERSATGGALLASDPHLEVNRLPAVWYEAVLNWGDDYVMGASLPGCPLVAVGRNRQLAWGVTYLKGDTSDFFIEDCRPSEQGWQYRRGERWHNFHTRQEVIQRKPGSTETLTVWYNDQGILESTPVDGEPGYYLSEAWTGHLPGVGRAMGVWLRVLEHGDAASAMDLVRDCPQPTLNWIFADRDGHIGQQACGWIPRRAGKYRGVLPIPAWDEANHWQGVLPADALPRSYDPPEGFVATANESVNRPGQPPLVTQTVSDYRKRRIDQRLSELQQATIEDFQTLQYDVYSLQARELLDVFLPLMTEIELKRRLADWDCRYHPDSVEATLFTRLYRNVLVEVFGGDPAAGGIGWRRVLFLSTRVGFSLMVVTSIDRLLKKDESLWWAGRDKGELIRRAAERVTNLDDEVPWAVFNAFRFTNRFFESKFVGRTIGLHTDELPMPGCHATVFQGHLLRVAKRETTFAPSYHFVADASANEAWSNLPGGASENGLSYYYKNDILLWREGRYKRLAP